MLSTSKKILLGFVAIWAFAANAKANDSKLPDLTSKPGIILVIDTLPPPPQKPEKQKQTPPQAKGKAKVKIKDVPRARPQQKPKVVGPKVKPVKIIKPKVGPKR